jgi:hypothetical protein
MGHPKPGQHILLPSIRGSLRRPLLKNGACPFPCMPLLSVLMRVTHTDWEVRTMFPGFRVMAMSIHASLVPSSPQDGRLFLSQSFTSF